MPMHPPSTLLRPCPNNSTADRRRRLRRHVHSAFGIILCAALSYTALWDMDDDSGLWSSRSLRRQLAFLDSHPVRTVPYGQSVINLNYQSFLKPSEIDGIMFFRNRTLSEPQPTTTMMEHETTNHDPEQAHDPLSSSSSCDNIFLFMPQTFAHHGHGSQLNNYILASLIATYTNRAMVLLEAPRESNEYKSNSQFGCPSEAWEYNSPQGEGTKDNNNNGGRLGKLKKIGWRDDFPNGFSRLIKHPTWLSHDCAVPCHDSVSYNDWNELRLAHKEDVIPYEVLCSSSSVSDISSSSTKDGEPRNDAPTNVIVMGGREVRDYFLSYYRDQMFHRDLSSISTTSSAARWAMRVGASSDEANIFANVLTDRQDIWDYMAAIMARSGLLRFQPWIARDVEQYMQRMIDLPLNVPYDAIHVRRGDKLMSDSRHLVINFWKSLGEYDAETGSMPQDYIPFRYYLRQFEESVECRATPRIVYVATDDVLEVQAEVENLTKDEDGNTFLTYNDEDGSGVQSSCHKFQFIFSRIDPTLGLHISTGPAKGNCEDRYARNIASIADLLILAKSNVYVGEYNSNWGRLLRLFRLRITNSDKILNSKDPGTVRAVTQRGQMLIAFGRKQPGPPGW